MGDKLTTNEQATTAALLINSQFDKAIPPIPDHLTREAIWAELQKLKGKVKKPKKVTCIKLLLEDERFTGLPIALLADIIKKVFERNGIDCNTSENSIRWYISQKTLDWDIKPRDKPDTSGIDLP